MNMAKIHWNLLMICLVLLNDDDVDQDQDFKLANYILTKKRPRIRIVIIVIGLDQDFKLANYILTGIVKLTGFSV